MDQPVITGGYHPWVVQAEGGCCDLARSRQRRKEMSTGGVINLQGAVFGGNRQPSSSLVPFDPRWANPA